MMKLVFQITQAQQALKELYGQKGYHQLIVKMKEKTNNDPVLLLAIYQDKDLFPAIRLVALSLLGE